MTRAGWDALSAREKDAIVAEKVMGWKIVREDHLTWWLSKDGVVPWLDKYDLKVHLPAYGGDWDAMRQVVEKMAGTDKDPQWLLELTRLREITMGDAMVYRAELRQCVEPWGMATAFALSAPEAVCLAALYALGHMEAA